MDFLRANTIKINRSKKYKFDILRENAIFLTTYWFILIGFSRKKCNALHWGNPYNYHLFARIFFVKFTMYQFLTLKSLPEQG